MKKKLLLLILLLINSKNYSFYENITLESITIEDHDFDIKDEISNCYKEVIQRLSRVWFALDILLSTQLDIPPLNETYFKISIDITKSLHILQKIHKNNYQNLEIYNQYITNIKSIVNFLFNHRLIKYNDSLLPSIEVLYCFLFDY